MLAAGAPGHPRRRHGRPLRAPDHLRGGRVSAIADLVHDAGGDRGRAPDGRAARAPRHGHRQGRRRQHHHPRRGHAPRALHAGPRSARPGCTAGAALSPATPIDALPRSPRETLDLALCMSVNPGWGGQTFIPHSLGKLERLRALLPGDVGARGRRRHPRADRRRRVQAGANLLVAGSAVFGSDDPAGYAVAYAAGATEPPRRRGRRTPAARGRQPGRGYSSHSSTTAPPSRRSSRPPPA